MTSDELGQGYIWPVIRTDLNRISENGCAQIHTQLWTKATNGYSTVYRSPEDLSFYKM